MPSESLHGAAVLISGNFWGCKMMTAGARVVSVDNSDCLLVVTVCTGEFHVEGVDQGLVHSPEIADGKFRWLDHVALCDGSCRAAPVDWAAVIKEREQPPLHTADGRVLPRVVRISAPARELIRRNPMAQLVSSWYAKWSGEEQVFCLGDSHIVVGTNPDWLKNPKSKTSQTTTIEVRPCPPGCISRACLSAEQQASLSQHLASMGC